MSKNNDHEIEKRKKETEYGKDNILWGDEVADIGIVAAGLGTIFQIPESYSYFAEKLDGLKEFGLDGAVFLAKKGDPNDYILYVGNINIDHWEKVLGKKIYYKRSYRYYMAIKKK